MTRFEQLLKDIDAGGYRGIMETGGDELQLLLSVACPLFERHDASIQFLAFAAMFGMASASLEGTTNAWEIETHELIDHTRRMELFIAWANAVYRDAMKDKPKNRSLM